MLGFTLTSLVSEGQELLWDWATTNDGGSSRLRGETEMFSLGVASL